MKSFTQFSKCGGYALKCVASAARGISVLLFVALPLAVFGTVVPVIVDSSNGHSVGSFSHISKEIGKSVPAFADRDPSTSIETEVRIFGIRDPLNHGIPRYIRWTEVVFSGMAVSSFILPATARLRVPPSEMCADDFGFISAVAETEAHRAGVSSGTVSVWKLSDDNEASKPLSDHGYSSRHSIGPFNVVFSGAVPATTGTHCDSNGFKQMNQFFMLSEAQFGSSEFGA